MNLIISCYLLYFSFNIDMLSLCVHVYCEPLCNAGFDECYTNKSIIICLNIIHFIDEITNQLIKKTINIKNDHQLQPYLYFTSLLSLQNVQYLHFTHRHHSESCVNYTGSNGGIDRLLNSGFLKDTSGVVENLEDMTTTKIKHERVFFLNLIFFFLMYLWCELACECLLRKTRKDFSCLFLQNLSNSPQSEQHLGFDTHSVDAGELLGELQDDGDQEGLAVEV